MTDNNSIALALYGETIYQNGLTGADAGLNVPKKEPKHYYFYGSSITPEFKSYVEEVYKLLIEDLGGYDNYVHAWWDPNFDNTEVLNGLDSLGFFYDSWNQKVTPSIEFVASQESCLSGFWSENKFRQQIYNYNFCNSWDPFTSPRLSSRKGIKSDDTWTYERLKNIAHEYFHAYQARHALGTSSVNEPTGIIAPRWITEGTANLFMDLFMRDHFDQFSLSKKLGLTYQDIYSLKQNEYGLYVEDDNHPHAQVYVGGTGIHEAISGIGGGDLEADWSQFKSEVQAGTTFASINEERQKLKENGNEGFVDEETNQHHELWNFLTRYLVHISSPKVALLDIWEDRWELGFAASFKKNVGITIDEFYDSFNNFFKSGSPTDLPPENFFLKNSTLANTVNFWSIQSGPLATHSDLNIPRFKAFHSEVGDLVSLEGIKDYDGNLHGSLGAIPESIQSSYKYQGKLDVNNDNKMEAIFTNKESGRWVTATLDRIFESKDPLTGMIDFSDHGQSKTTRIVGIYQDPLVANGTVEKDSVFDGSRTFINDLKLDNLILKTVGDYDSDGFQEVYWSKVDNSAYLRAVMHADGNIQYANYQNLDQMTDYLTGNGFADTVALIA